MRHSQLFKTIATPSLISRVALVLGLLFALQQPWHAHFEIASDGLAYVDIGDAYFKGDWGTAINAHWSPLYSWLLGAANRLTRPRVSMEGVAAQVVNLLIFGLSFIAFKCFLDTMKLHRIPAEQRLEQDNCGIKYLPVWLLDLIGYSLFLWSSLALITVYNISPDLLVSALSYFMFALALRTAVFPNKEWPYLALGALAGMSYLAKTAMLFIGPSFLLVPLFFPKPVRTRKIIMSVLCFIVIAGPFVVILSLAKGRVTFGDTGRYNYIRYVLGVGIPVHWQGTSGIGVPVHPTRKVGESPAIYEFDGPIGGTYPPWHEPSYWYDTGKLKYNPLAIMRVAVGNVLDYAEMVCRGGRYKDVGLDRSVLFGLVCLVAVCSVRRWLREVFRYASVTVPACCGLFLYALVHAEPRLVAPFLTALLVVGFASLRMPYDQTARRLIIGVAFVLSLFWICPLVSSGLRESYSQLPAILAAKGVPAIDETQSRIAAAISGARIPWNSKVAFIGRSTRFFWAKIAGVRVVAEIRQYDMPPESAPYASREVRRQYALAAPDVDSFWQGPATGRERVYDTLAKMGVRAIIAQDPAESNLPAEWHKIEGTDYCICLM